MIVVMPMAGRGSRYANQGYEIPKPLINVAGQPMILWALKSLEGLAISRLVVVLLREHEESWNVRKLISNKISTPIDIVLLENTTEGQLCTVLAAKEYLEPGEDVLIASSDTLVQNKMQDDISDSRYDGIISVANLPGEQWSFAKTDETGKVVEVAEKRRISEHASTGLYYFRRAAELITYGEDMIRKQEKTRGEYYVIPVYQKMIEHGAFIGISRATAMWDMGTPEAKEKFERNFRNS